MRLLNDREKSSLEFQKKFWSIVNNLKTSFSDKIDLMHKLNEEQEMRESDQKHRQDIMNSLRKMDVKIAEVQKDQQMMMMNYVHHD